MISKIPNTNNVVVVGDDGRSTVLPLKEVLDFVANAQPKRRPRYSRTPGGTLSRKISLYSRAVKTGKWSTGADFDPYDAAVRLADLLGKARDMDIQVTAQAGKIAMDTIDFVTNGTIRGRLINEIQKCQQAGVFP